MEVDSEQPKVIHSKDPNFSVSSFPPMPSYWNIPPYEDQTTILDYWRILKKQKFKIITITLIVTFFCLWTALKTPKQYQAEVTLTPISPLNNTGGVSSLLSQANSIPIVGGQLGSLTGERQQAQQFINILKSRTLIEKVIQDLHLMPLLFKNQWDSLKNNWKVNDESQIPKLEDGAGVVQGRILRVLDDKKTGLLRVQILFEDPQWAATIANHFVVRLQDFITNNSLTVAKRNRQFIEIQLQKNKIDFLEFSKKLSQFYTTNQISNSQSKLDVDVGKMELLPKTFEEFRQELQELEQQKEGLKPPTAETGQNGVVKNVPAQVYLQYLNLQRELLGKMNALLLQQYQMAKVEESKEDLMFQVIDKAIVPAAPSFPKVKRTVAIGFLGGLLGSIFLVLVIEYIKKLKMKEEAH